MLTILRSCHVATSRSVAFVARSGSAAAGSSHTASCICPACVSVHRAGCACASCSRSAHSASCVCGACAGRFGTALFADVAAETETEAEPEVPAKVAAEETMAEAPAAVEAMDGIDSDEEAHNAERPARANLKKKRPRVRILVSS
jgi:hypothetical protein